MNRTAVAVAAILIAFTFLVSTSWVGFTAVPNPSTDSGYNLQQSDSLNIDVWLSWTGATKPVRRLDPGTSEAQVVLQSNLRATDPSSFRVDLWDASGIRVFQSDALALPTGAYTETVLISGKNMFQGYTNYVNSWKTVLVDEVGQAVSSAEKDTPSASQVGDRIRDTQPALTNVSNGVDHLRSFDLSSDGGADAAFASAETAVGTVDDRLSEALDLLDADPIEWDDVRAKLGAAQTAADDAATQIDTGLGAVNRDAERSFPSTGVSGQCNQNLIQLRVAGSDAISGDFWWTVGTPGAPARLTNPEDPGAENPVLSPKPNTIYSTLVEVSDAPHSTVIETLVLDDTCLPVPGASVTASTPAGSIVAIPDPEVTADENGLAKITVNATAELGDGTATVNVAAGSVETPVRGLTVIGPPAWINLRLGGSEVKRVPNYGVGSVVQISAVVRDANNNEVANGTPVDFSIESTDHTCSDCNQVPTEGGQASATLIFGSTTDFYEVSATTGDVSDSQAIRVVGVPANIEVEAEPRIIPVNTASIDQRSSTLTVTVTDSEDQPAPDGTIAEFKLLDSNDEDWAFFRPRDSQGRSRVPIIDGQASVTLVGNPTWYRKVEIGVMATYSVGGDVRGSVSTDPENPLIVVLRGESVFLPLIRRSQ